MPCNRYRRFAPILLLGSLAACSGIDQRPPQRPAKPVVPPAPKPAPAVKPTPPPVSKPAPVQAAPLGSKPVRSLMAKARDQAQQGELEAAAASLERALRIEQHNPHLWNRLAQVRLDQGRHAQAAAMAAKSDALAGTDSALRQDNARILRQSR